MILYCIKLTKFTKDKNAKIKLEVDGKINIYYIKHLHMVYIITMFTKFKLYIHPEYHDIVVYWL